MTTPLADDQNVITGPIEKLSSPADVTLILIPGYVALMPVTRTSAVLVAGTRSALSLQAGSSEALSLQEWRGNCHCRQTFSRPAVLGGTPPASPGRVRWEPSRLSRPC